MIHREEGHAGVCAADLCKCVVSEVVVLSCCCVSHGGWLSVLPNGRVAALVLFQK